MAEQLNRSRCQCRQHRQQRHKRERLEQQQEGQHQGQQKGQQGKQQVGQRERQQVKQRGQQVGQQLGEQQGQQKEQQGKQQVGQQLGEQQGKQQQVGKQVGQQERQQEGQQQVGQHRMFEQQAPLGRRPRRNLPAVLSKFYERIGASPEEVLADLDSLEGGPVLGRQPPPPPSKPPESTGARAKSNMADTFVKNKERAKYSDYEATDTKTLDQDSKNETVISEEIDNNDENGQNEGDNKDNEDRRQEKEDNNIRLKDKSVVKENDDKHDGKGRETRELKSRGKSGVLEACNPFSGTLWRRREPYAHLWVSLSSVYGKLMVVLMLVLCLAEIMNNHIRPLTVQSFFMMYLLVVSIVVMTCLYVTVLLDNCPSPSRMDAETGSLPSMGTIRRSHIDKRRVSRTSFYLRVGALLFGLGTLVFNGLEIALHATMEQSCVDNVLVAFPVLQAIFTFLQMHFLFINSQVLVERFSLAARFGFMHLVATNLALWIKSVVWESANEYVHYLYALNNSNKNNVNGFGSNGNFDDLGNGVNTLPIALSLSSQTNVAGVGSDFLGPYRRDYVNNRRSLEPNINDVFENSQNLVENATIFNNCSHFSSPLLSATHVDFVVELYKCYNSNSLGRLWTTSMPYLFPFLVEYRLKTEVHFSLIAAAVTLVMWRQVGTDKAAPNRLVLANANIKNKSLAKSEAESRVSSAYWRVNCDNASKGLFLGLLCLVGGVIALILFFVMKEQNGDFGDSIFYLYTLTQNSMLTLGTLAAILALVQLQKVSRQAHREPLELDEMLSDYTILGPFLHSCFSIVAAMADLTSINLAVATLHLLLLLQLISQKLVLAEASRRACSTRLQQISKPGRQAITLLLFINAALCALDTLMSHSVDTQRVQIQFFGRLAWAFVQRIALPMLTLHRFHACVLLVEVWKNTYRTRESF